MGTAKVDIVIQKTVIVEDNQWNKTIEDRVSGLTKKAYGWSKWGGANYGLVQKQKTEEWNCQACGEKEGSEMPSYMFEIIPSEFIRICSNCQALKNIHSLKTMHELLRLVRKIVDPWGDI
jgi:hypothetical protein